MLQQIWAPSARGFLLAMLNGSFAFFFFAFQGNFSLTIFSFWTSRESNVFVLTSEA